MSERYLREALAHRLLGYVKDLGVNVGPSIYDIADALLPDCRDYARQFAAEVCDAERAKVDGAIRALHSPVDRGTGPQCQGCATNVSFTPWPCKTIRALEAAEVRTA